MKKLFIAVAIAVAFCLGSAGVGKCDFPLPWAQEMIMKAESGDVEAQYSLGNSFFVGFAGLSVDHYEAAKWFYRAASQGHARAQGRLGMMYYKGFGVRKNTNTALEWFKKSCDNGYQDGCDTYRKISRGEVPF